MQNTNREVETKRRQPQGYCKAQVQTPDVTYVDRMARTPEPQVTRVARMGQPLNYNSGGYLSAGRLFEFVPGGRFPSSGGHQSRSGTGPVYLARMSATNCDLDRFECADGKAHPSQMRKMALTEKNFPTAATAFDRRYAPFRNDQSPDVNVLCSFRSDGDALSRVAMTPDRDRHRMPNTQFNFIAKSFDTKGENMTSAGTVTSTGPSPDRTTPNGPKPLPGAPRRVTIDQNQTSFRGASGFATLKSQNVLTNPMTNRANKMMSAAYQNVSPPKGNISVALTSSYYNEQHDEEQSGDQDEPQSHIRQPKSQMDPKCREDAAATTSAERENSKVSRERSGKAVKVTLQS
jgi:hypothetical protein